MSNGVPVTSTVDADGFYAAAFVNSSNQIIIAFQGTNPSSPDFGAQVQADLTLAKGQIPAAAQDGLEFRASVAAIAADQGLPTDGNIGDAGHSLGGFIAQFVAAENGDNGAAFGSPGIPDTGETNNPNFTNYVIPGDPFGNSASDTQFGQAMGITNITHFGSVVSVGDPATAEGLMNAAAEINNPLPGLQGAAVSFYGVGALAETVKNHAINNYGNALGVSLQPDGSVAVNPYETLAGLDAPLGQAGAADMSQVVVVSPNQVDTPNFDVTLRFDGSLSITQNQAIFNDQGVVSNVIGTSIAQVDQQTGNLTSISESTTTMHMDVQISAATGNIIGSQLYNADGTSAGAVYQPNGSSVVTDYNSNDQVTSQTSYGAPSPTSPSPTPSPTPPSPTPPSPTPPSPTPPSPTPPSPTPPSPTPPSPAPSPSPGGGSGGGGGGSSGGGSGGGGGHSVESVRAAHPRVMSPAPGRSTTVLSHGAMAAGYGTENMPAFTRVSSGFTLSSLRHTLTGALTSGLRHSPVATLASSGHTLADAIAQAHASRFGTQGPAAIDHMHNQPALLQELAVTSNSLHPDTQISAAGHAAAVLRQTAAAFAFAGTQHATSPIGAGALDGRGHSLLDNGHSSHQS